MAERGQARGDTALSLLPSPPPLMHTAPAQTGSIMPINGSLFVVGHFILIIDYTSL